MPRPITPSVNSCGSAVTQPSVMESPMKTTLAGVVSAALALRYLHRLGQSLLARSSTSGSGGGGRHGSDTIAVVDAAASAESAWTAPGADIRTDRNANASDLSNRAIAVCGFIYRPAFIQVVSSTNTVAIGSVAGPGNSMSTPDARFVIFSGFFDASASRNAPVTLRGTRSRWKVAPGQVKSSM